MGHLGHGFHNNLHYHRRKPYGPGQIPFPWVVAEG